MSTCRNIKVTSSMRKVLLENTQPKVTTSDRKFKSPQLQDVHNSRQHTSQNSSYCCRGQSAFWWGKARKCSKKNKKGNKAAFRPYLLGKYVLVSEVSPPKALSGLPWFQSRSLKSLLGFFFCFNRDDSLGLKTLNLKVYNLLESGFWFFHMCDLEENWWYFLYLFSNQQTLASLS